MRMAAHHLVRFMTAGMALITCHEPVLISINGQLKNAFLNALGVSSSVISVILRCKALLLMMRMRMIVMRVIVILILIVTEP